MKFRNKTGIIGFFDILGYKNLLKSNPPDVIMDKIIVHLTEIGPITSRRINELAQIVPVSERIIDVDEICSHFEWTVFADSILITLEIEDKSKYAFNQWYVFTIACLLLDQNTFSYGIPLRGAINYGEYLTHKCCFAGGDIIGAYELGNNINLSAIVLSNRAVKSIQELEEYGRILDTNYIQKSPIPCKYENTILMYSIATDKTFHSKESMSKTIRNSFAAWNKEIGPKEEKILKNTITHQLDLKAK